MDIREELERDVAALQELATRMRAAAHECEVELRPPPESLWVELREARSRFTARAAEMLGAAHDLGLLDLGPLSSVRDLQALARRLERARADGHIRQAARVALMRVEQLACTDTRYTGAVEKLREEARRSLGAAIFGEADLTDALTASTLRSVQSLEVLFELIEPPDSLSDERMDLLEESVEGAFGKEVRRAALRRRLTFGARELEERRVPGSPPFVPKPVIIEPHVGPEPEPAAVAELEPVAEPEPMVDTSLEAATAEAKPEPVVEPEPVTVAPSAEPEPTVEALSSPLDAVTASEPLEAVIAQGPEAQKVPDPAQKEVTVAPEPAESVADKAVVASARQPEQSAPSEVALPEIPVAQPAELAGPDSDGARRPKSEEFAADIGTKARLARSATGPRRVALLVRLIWELLDAGRVGIAYHLKKAADDGGEPLADAPSAPLLRAYAASPLIHASFGEAVDDLHASLVQLRESAAPGPDRDPAARTAETLLVLACFLRATLFAPRTRAAAVLEDVELYGELSELNPLRNAILGLAQLNIELTPEILKGVREQAAWQSQVTALREKCRQWREHSRQAKIVYAPATHVWRRWMEDDGPLAKPFALIADDGNNHLDAVKASLEQWSTPSHVERMIDRTDREVRPDARSKTIEARARVRLRSYVADATKLLREWVELFADDPSRNREQSYARAAECRRQVVDNLGSARKVGDRVLAATPPSSPVSLSARILLRSLAAIEGLFSPAAPVTPDVPLADVLHGELLAIREKEPPSGEGRAGSRGTSATIRVDDVLDHLARGPVDWLRVFHEQKDAGNHEATDQLLDMLTRRPVDNIDVAQLRRLQEKDVVERRTRFERSVEATQAAVERAIIEDLFPESEILDLQGCMAGLQTDAVRNFARAERPLADVRARIGRRRQERIEGVRARLPQDPAEAKPIEQALEKGDLLTANEMLAMSERGQPLRSQDAERDVFQEMFPRKLEDIQSFVEAPGLDRQELCRALGRRENRGPFDMGRVAEGQEEELQKMLSSWGCAINFEGSEAGGNLSAALVDVLQAIGFRNVRLSSIAGPSSNRIRSYDMTADAVGEQSVCVISQYGSLAKGRYRVLCVWRWTPDEELVDVAGASQHHDQPIILLYFGRMNVARRKSLAALCRQRGRTLLLLDELVLFFLATEGHRLPAFFSCTLPFTVADPYTTTAGLVPSEMFFGRDRERRSIFEPFGTNLVYGGRQLGKTALLRDVERRHHAPSRGVIVRWIDLKTAGIGIDRPIRDLWTVIADALRKDQIALRPDLGVDKMGQQILDWLEKEAGRRIVLLLDEADAFLKSDAETREESGEVFANLWRLKGVMDRSGRCFKVVFAGLHNVQRSSRDENSPLAHLGAPICIGPLLEDGDWREARRLVTKPLMQLGYRFESDDLPMRILAHANWYPSLIQLFCKHMLGHLSHPSRASFPTHRCPPYVITSQHIDEAYRSRELRKAIVDRFRWTLDLDPRYRIIALCIALESAAQRDDPVAGLSVQWIRQQALSWWDAGFKGTTTIEAFRTILDEMIGLGVLRKVGGTGYALRSTNVVNLLGTKKEIEDALIDAACAEPPPEYDAATFRRSLDTPVTRSPLTARQEAEILVPSNGVVVLFGSKPAGLDDTERSLRRLSAVRAVGVEDPGRLAETATQFKAFLDDRAEKRKEALSLLVIPSSRPWTVDWVIEASTKLQKLSSQNRFLRVVFMADPEKAWSWVQSDPDVRSRLTSEGVTEMTLGPWHRAAVRRWLIDSELGSAGGNDVDRFTRVTGNWGALLHEVATRREHDSRDWHSYLDEIEASAEHADRWLAQFEVQDLPRPSLQALAEMQSCGEKDEALGADELSELIGSGTNRTELKLTIERSMEWGELLGYVTLDRVGWWRIDPLLGRLLRGRPK